MGGNWLGQQLNGLLDLLFPRACPVCQSPFPDPAVSPFCPACMATLCPLPAGRCSCCALPFSAAESSSHLCADCLRKLPPFTSVCAAGLYAGALKKALQRFKYSGVVDLDRPLADLLQSQLPPLGGDEIMVPVPLHPHRLRQRGYNQSLLLAKILAQNLRIFLEPTILERNIDSHSQQGLSARQRARNLRGAFHCTRSLKGGTLLLVDDVMTTGATLTACSHTLLDAGAARVSVAVIARAPRHRN